MPLRHLQLCNSRTTPFVKNCNTMKVKKRLCLGITFIAAVSCVSGTYFFDDFRFHHLIGSADAQNSSVVTILLWSPPLWYLKRYGKGKSNPVYAKMPKVCGACKFTNDRRLIADADVVVVHDNFVAKGDFPSVSSRNPRQKYVFWTKENPYHTKVLLAGSARSDLKLYDAGFNLTMTYRSDSDVQITYGCVANAMKEAEKLNNRPTKKRKIAVMLASDCRRLGARQRIKYSDALVKAGLKVERYGACFDGRFKGDVTKLLKQFKFFLSFENGLHCREYITEKFWTKSLASGLVPVVWGPTKDDLARVAPAGSYIHAEDFNSAKELAHYLLDLDRNDTAYLEYFRWRNLPQAEYLESNCGDPPMLPVPKGFCSLCRKVKSETNTVVIPSITEWWYGTESRECLAKNLTKEKSRYI